MEKGEGREGRREKRDGEGGRMGGRDTCSPEPQQLPSSCPCGGRRMPSWRRGEEEELASPGKEKQ